MTGMLLLSSGVAVLFIDQLSKTLALRSVARSHRRRTPARIRTVFNHHGSLGLAHRTRTLAMLWILTVVPAVMLAIEYASLLNTLAIVSLGAAAGGASSNLLDRIGRRGVVDFVVIGRLPGFNIADCAIVGGVGALWGAILIPRV